RPGATAEQAHRFLDRQRVGQLRVLELDAESLAQGPPLAASGPVQPEDLHVPRIASREPLQDLDGGGLAGAVRPEQAEALARGHREIEPGDRQHVPVAFDQAGAADGGHAQAGFFGSGGVIAFFRAASSCICMLFTASASARIFMSTPPPRDAITDIVPATSATVPTLLVSAR